MKKILSFILSMILLLSCFSFGSYADSFEYSTIASDNEWALLRLINEYRVKNGKGAASMTVALQDVSGIRSRELLGSLSHYRPDGSRWDTVLAEGNIGYDSESYEIIAANMISTESLINALLNSQTNRERLLSDNLHIGIGYSESADTPNSSAYCIIGIACDEKGTAELCNTEDIHLVYGDTEEGIDIVLRRSCSHGKGYLQVLPSMIEGYDTEKMGSSVLNVSFEGERLPFDIVNDYTDCVVGAWYYDAVMSCTDNGYFSGMGKGVFGVKSQMTREMFVTVLGRFAVIDPGKYEGTSFEDVAQGQWYSPYIEWAYREGIVSGDGKGRFNGKKPITRQEICVILNNFITKYDMDIGQVNAAFEFADSDSIASWALESVTFCQTRAIVSGNNKGEFMPMNDATRCEVAVIIDNLAGSIYSNDRA